MRDLVGAPRIGPCADAHREQSRPDVPPEHILTPPPGVEPREALLRVVERPVELWREVIEPPFVQPAACVGERLGVGVQTGDALRVAGPPDAERADADEHPPLPRFHLAI